MEFHVEADLPALKATQLIDATVVAEGGAGGVGTPLLDLRILANRSGTMLREGGAVDFVHTPEGRTGPQDGGALVSTAPLGGVGLPTFAHGGTINSPYVGQSGGIGGGEAPTGSAVKGELTFPMYLTGGTLNTSMTAGGGAVGTGLAFRGVYIQGDWVLPNLTHSTICDLTLNIVAGDCAEGAGAADAAHLVSGRTYLPALSVPTTSDALFPPARLDPDSVGGGAATYAPLAGSRVNIPLPMRGGLLDTHYVMQGDKPEKGGSGSGGAWIKLEASFYSPGRTNIGGGLGGGGAEIRSSIVRVEKGADIVITGTLPGGASSNGSNSNSGLTGTVSVNISPVGSGQDKPETGGAASGESTGGMFSQILPVDEYIRSPNGEGAGTGSQASDYVVITEGGSVVIKIDDGNAAGAGAGASSDPSQPNLTIIISGSTSTATGEPVFVSPRPRGEPDDPFAEVGFGDYAVSGTVVVPGGAGGILNLGGLATGGNLHIVDNTTGGESGGTSPGGPANESPVTPDNPLVPGGNFTEDDLDRFLDSLPKYDSSGVLQPPTIDAERGLDGNGYVPGGNPGNQGNFGTPPTETTPGTGSFSPWAHPGINCGLTRLRADIQGLVILPTVTGDIDANLTTLSAKLKTRPANKVVLTAVFNTRTASASSYEDYEFNSYCRVGGRYFGGGPNGVAELYVGDADDERQIPAEIATGLFNPGDAQQKRLLNLYTLAKLDREMTLTVGTDEMEANTSVLGIQSAAGLVKHRATLARGLRGKHWQIKVGNIEGADFEISGLELEFAPSARRI